MAEVKKKKLRKIEFQVDGVDAQGEAVKVNLKVVTPTAAQIEEAELVYKKRYGVAVRSGVLMSIQLDKELQESGTWTDEDKEKFAELHKRIVEGELLLRRGGVKKSEAREAALKMHDARRELSDLLAPRYAIEDNTAEAVAKQAENDFLVSVCTRYGDGEDRENGLYFERPTSYLERKGDADAIEAAKRFFELVYHGREPVKNPEQAFLEKYGFIDAEGRLVDPQGRLVDRQGRLVDEEGYLIDGEGKRVTPAGEPIPAEEDFVEFLDD